MRLAGAALLAITTVSLAACGGGGDKSSSATTAPPTTSSSTDKTSTTKPPAVHTPETPTSPEDKPGGAGDETPAHFDAKFTGRGGTISPRHVSVGPFISVRVVLTSGDGQRYALSIKGKTLEAGGSDDTARLTLPGLKAGQSYTLRQPAGGSSVKVVANAEPGP